MISLFLKRLRPEPVLGTLNLSSLDCVIQNLDPFRDPISTDWAESSDGTRFDFGRAVHRFIEFLPFATSMFPHAVLTEV